MNDIPFDPNHVASALREELIAWMTRLAEEEVAQIKEDISVPVEIVERNGVWFIIRSRPGEPPRTETGALIAGVSFAIEDSDQLPNILIYSERHHVDPETGKEDDPNVPQYLEAMRRPYITTSYQRVRDRLRT